MGSLCKCVAAGDLLCIIAAYSMCFLLIGDLYSWNDKIELPVKIQPRKLTGGVGRPPLGAIFRRPSLARCLVGHDVRWSVLGLGWSVWSGLWVSFVCVTQDTIVCDFVCIFNVFSSYSGLVLLKT